MTPPEEQSGRKRGSNRFVPDEQKDREPRCSADADGALERPRFVLDPQEDSRASSRDSGALDCPGPSVSEQVDGETLPQGRRRESTSSPDVVAPPDWRNLVSAKVSSYKSRRPRPHRYPSLQLKFEPPSLSREARPDSGMSSEPARYPMSGAAVPDLEPPVGRMEAPTVPEATARVLEFPRSLALPMRWDELAEPIIDRPRIVEAPELVPPPPAMGGILIEPSERPEPERRAGFDMPLASAGIRRRLTAGLLDALVVGLAMVAFAYVFLRFTDAEPTWKTLGEIALGLAAVLWPAYQFAFVVFSGTTPGLRLCRLRIERFDGTPAPRKLRGWRVVVSLLSAVSLAIGYLWCFLDEDQLSWHDRITSTHLAEAKAVQPGSGSI